MAQLVKKLIYEFDNQRKIFFIHTLGYNLKEHKQTRKIRGALTIIASLTNTIFGTATQSQIDYTSIHRLDT